jgi:hypothetical protein
MVMVSFFLIVSIKILSVAGIIHWWSETVPKIWQHVSTSKARLHHWFTLAIFAAIASAIFSFWWMWTSRWVTNVRSTCTLSWTLITYPLVHIHQKKKIAAKIASVNEPWYKNRFIFEKHSWIEDSRLLSHYYSHLFKMIMKVLQIGKLLVFNIT